MIEANSTPGKKETFDDSRKSKSTGIAGWVFFFAIFGVCTLVVVDFSIGLKLYLLRFCPLILELSGLIGIILVLLDFSTTKRIHSEGLRRKLVNIIVIFIGILIILSGILAQRFRVTMYALICGGEISGISKALLLYSNDNENRYPPVEKWCDLLIEKEEVARGQFRCPGAWFGQCHYAMNPNCEPNSPDDVVLLFETKGGWNQYGGPELLTFNNHSGKGVFVAFNDGYLKFIKPEDVSKLKWKAEDGNNVK